jgi:transcriptional regulator with XRE-family HTH domain
MRFTRIHILYEEFALEVYEKINRILEAKKMTKREFSNKLRNLSPVLKSTGECPSETTVYKYLSGDISIPIELVPFIAEALNTTEQELFDDSFEAKCKFCRYIQESSNSKEMESLMKCCYASIIQASCDSKFDYEEKIKRLHTLLAYASPMMLDKMIETLEKSKKNIKETKL